MKRKLLLLLPQSPFDPTSGAPRSLLSICRLLSERGYQVQTLCTTAFDSKSDREPQSWHEETLGLKVQMIKMGTCVSPVWSFHKEGITHHLVNTPGETTSSWNKAYGEDFVNAAHALAASFTPDVVLTYGGSKELLNCRDVFKSKGAAIVLGLRNHGYFAKGAMNGTDYGLASSKWLAKKYADFFGRPVEGLPSPLIEKEIIPATKEPVFFTFVNPSLHKGALFFVRMAEELSLKRTDIPLLILDSHGRGAQMVSMGLKYGIDLRRHENIMLAPAVPTPKDFMHITRAVLAPSLWDEPSGRVAAEAHLCGIPALVSDRGGLPETVGKAGIVLPIHKSIKKDSTRLPKPAHVRQWVDMIIRMADDEEFYSKCAKDAAESGLAYREEAIAPQYVEFFNSVKKQG